MRTYKIKIAAFQSTPSVWRETAKLATETGLSVISIHSLRVEGDRNAKAAIAKAEISIHSLRVEGDRDKF